MKTNYMQTKIVCTIGPASNNEAVLTDLIRAGMNVARLNFSHNTHKDHLETIKLIKKVRDKLHAPVAILLDTKGPEIRLRTFEGGSALLKKGEEFTLTTREVEGNAQICTISYADLPSQLTPGINVLIDDGKIRLEVTEIEDTDIRCKVLSGGKVSDRKSINIPKVHLDLPYLSAADEADLIFGIEQDVDFIAASFVRCKEDVVALRKFVNYHGGHKIRIISKIENIEGVENFDEILKASDGIMVARGDMGVEVDFEKLPGIQKKFIRSCYQAGKMVITATQMLESMIHSTTPTRAEITDVANAVFDGTSAVMLSGETAVGDHPVHVVEVMAKIARQAERDAFEMGVYKGLQHENDFTSTTNAICDAACKAASDLHASAIIAVTKSGETARRVSKFRPDVPIVAATPDEKTFHQLALSWGVFPVLALPQNDTDTLFRHAIDCAKQIDVVEAGDKVVITGGVPLNLPGYTNILKVQTV
ncbi:MAG: pyruvate kinase [Eubacteriales bacterium]